MDDEIENLVRTVKLKQDAILLCGQMRPPTEAAIMHPSFWGSYCADPTTTPTVTVQALAKRLHANQPHTHASDPQNLMLPFISQDLFFISCQTCASFPLPLLHISR